MGLLQKIEEDMKASMIAKDADKLSTLRFLKSAIKYVIIEKKAEALSDADIQLIIQKQIKQRRESVEQFRNAGRTELADKEFKEIGCLESYLPKQLSDAELEAAIKEQMAANGAGSKKDFGRMMKILSEKLSGQAEARRISEFLNKNLV